MAFCSQCGKEIPAGARFCPSCGAAVSGAASGSASAAPIPPETARPSGTPVYEDPPERRGEFSALAILALVAIVVVAVVLWQQRDGARPVAGNATEVAAEDDATGSERPTSSESDAGVAVSAGGGATEEATGSSDAVQAMDEADDAEEAGGGGEIIPAAAIDGAFRDDRIEAAMRFPGAVTVRGEVAAPNRAGDSVSLEGRDRFNFMVVNFAADQQAAAEGLSKGQVITVRCSGAGSLAGTTILRDCRF